MQDLQSFWVCRNGECPKKGTCARFSVHAHPLFPEKKADPRTCGEGSVSGRSHTYRMLYVG